MTKHIISQLWNSFNKASFLKIISSNKFVARVSYITKYKQQFCLQKFPFYIWRKIGSVGSSRYTISIHYTRKEIYKHYDLPKKALSQEIRLFIADQYAIAMKNNFSLMTKSTIFNQ